MPIVSAKCTQCGASLEVDVASDAAICPYCHQAFIVENAINNYNVAHADIHADVVNITQDNRPSAEESFQKAYSYFSIAEYSKAKEGFIEALALGLNVDLPEVYELRFLGTNCFNGHPILSFNTLRYLELYPTIQQWEATFLNQNIGNNAELYFRVFYPYKMMDNQSGYLLASSGQAFSSAVARCEYYFSSGTRSLPQPIGYYVPVFTGFESWLFYATSYGKYCWRDANELKYIFEHDYQKEIQPYRQFQVDRGNGVVGNISPSSLRMGRHG